MAVPGCAYTYRRAWCVTYADPSQPGVGASFFGRPPGCCSWKSTATYSALKLEEPVPGEPNFGHPVLRHDLEELETTLAEVEVELSTSARLDAREDLIGMALTFGGTVSPPRAW